MRLPQDKLYLEVAVDRGTGLAHRLGKGAPRPTDQAGQVLERRIPDRRRPRCQPNGELLPLASAHTADQTGMQACTEPACFGQGG